MGAITDIIAAVEARMLVLGFEQSNDVFDFDTVPSSNIHKAFRIETRILRNPYHSGDVANPREELIIWIAYRATRDVNAAWKSALNDRESVERDLINAASISGLSCDPLLQMDSEASAQKYLESYLVSKLAFTVDYVRDIS